MADTDNLSSGDHSDDAPSDDGLDRSGRMRGTVNDTVTQAMQNPNFGDNQSGLSSGDDWRTIHSPQPSVHSHRASPDRVSRQSASSRHSLRSHRSQRSGRTSKTSRHSYHPTLSSDTSSAEEEPEPRARPRTSKGSEDGSSRSHSYLVPRQRPVQEQRPRPDQQEMQSCSYAQRRSETSNDDLQKRMQQMEKDFERLLRKQKEESRNSRHKSSQSERPRAKRMNYDQARAVVPRFSGEAGEHDISWENWLDLYKNTGEGLGWEELDYVIMLPNLLTKKASQCFFTMTIEERRTWDNIEAKFTTLFSKPKTRGMEVCNLLANFKQPGQTVLDYMTVFNSLSSNAYPQTRRTPENDALLAGIFINGLEPDERSEVWKESPETVQHACEVARRVESLKALNKLPHPKAVQQKKRLPTENTKWTKEQKAAWVARKAKEAEQKTNAEQTQKVPEKKNQEVKYQAKSAEVPQGGTRPTEGCFSCGRPGHFANRCPYPPQKPSGSGSHVHVLETDEFYDPEAAKRFLEILSTGDVHSAFAVQENQTKRYRAVVAAQVGGKVHDALIDTGADCSLIRKSAAANNGAIARNPTVKPAGPTTKLTQMDGEVKVEGTVIMEVQVGTIQWKSRFLIVENLTCDMLIGDDIFRKYKNVVTCDYNKGVVKIDQSPEIPMKFTWEIPPQVLHVSLTEKITIPPFHKQVVQGKLDAGFKPEVNYVFEGALSGKPFYAKEAVVKPVDKYVPVQLWNLTDKPCEMDIDEVIGHVEEPDENTEIKVLSENGLCDFVGWNPSFSTQNVEVRGALSDRSQETLLECEKESSNVNVVAEGVISQEEMIEQMLENAKKLFSEEQVARARDLLKNFADIFVTSSFQYGAAKVQPFEIDTGDTKPIRQQAYRLPESKKEAVEQITREMLANGAIEPSNSPWASPICLARKKDGSWRLCTDMRKVNAVTQKLAYPLNRIDDLIDSLAEFKLFSSFDLASGYNQVPLTEDAKAKTAFITHEGLFHHVVLNFGCANAPAHFSRIINDILPQHRYKFIKTYLDDILVGSKTFDEMLKNLAVLFEVLRSVKLKIKAKKCTLFATELPFLGFIIGKDGIKADPAKITSIMDYPALKSVKQVQEFMGLVNYYARFVPKLACLASPLFQLLKKDVKFQWRNDVEQKAMDDIKACFRDEVVLQFPDFSKPFILQTDASGTGIAAILSQIVNEETKEERPIAFASRHLKDTETRYPATQQEVLAVHWGLNHFRYFLLGKEFTLMTDCQPIKYLKDFKGNNQMLNRWSMELQEFIPTMKIVHRSGKSNGNADAVSRCPLPEDLASALGDGQVSLESNSLTVGTVCTVSQIFPFDLEHVKKYQMSDTRLGGILKFLREGKLPKKAKKAQRIKDTAKQFFVENDVLFHKWYQRGKQKSKRKFVQLAIPQRLVTNVLEYYHDSVFGCHKGAFSTFLQIREKYFWFGMFKAVQNFCKTCPVCASYKLQVPQLQAPLHPIPITEPFERVGIDLVEMKRSDAGNTYVLTAICAYTKYCELTSIPNMQAETVARALIESVFLRHSWPRAILSDNGKEFVSKIMVGVCKLLGIDKKHTTAFWPRGNGQTERVNRSINDMLSVLVNSHHTDWDLYLPFVTYAINTKIHETTKFKPFYLVYGREDKTFLDRLCDLDSQAYLQLPDYAKQTGERLRKAFAIVGRNIRLEQHRQAKQYNKKMFIKPLFAGDFVMLRNTVLKPGLSRRFTRKYTGPYRVIEVLNPRTVKICRLHGEKVSVVHYNRLKILDGKLRKIRRVAKADPNIESSADEDSDTESLKL